MSKTSKPLPEWERVLSAASRLQTIVPDAILVGGTAVAIHTGHRQSQDGAAQQHVVHPFRFDSAPRRGRGNAGHGLA